MYSRSQEYRKQEVLGATPLRLVIMAYDLAIRSCDQQDFETAAKAVGGLRDALDLDYAEVAYNLLSLYQWVLDRLRKGEFNEAKKTLVELRDAWVTVEKNLNAGVTSNIRPGATLAARAA
ncbi:MAG: flagellar export chaperone FliS [Anaerolineaceae bacterium]